MFVPSERTGLSSVSSYACIIKRFMAPAVDVLLSTVRPVTVRVTSLLGADGSRCGDSSVFSLPAGTRACLRAFLVFSLQENSPWIVWWRIGPVQLNLELRKSEAAARFLAPHV